MPPTGLAFAALGWLAVLGCAASTPPPAQTPAPRTPITEIALERICFGCPDPVRIVLRRDGTATHTRPGNARQGVADVERIAAIDAAAFDGLARAVERAGFFQLSDEYADPATADAPAVVTTVIAGAEKKSIADRGARGPDALRNLEQAILRVADALTWKDR